MYGMIPKIHRGSNPAGLVRYLFGPGKKNEHRNQHLVCASADMLESFDLDGRPTQSYKQIGRLFDRRYHRLERAGDPCPPDRRTDKHNPEHEHGLDRVWHCSLSIKATHGVLDDTRWEQIIREFLHEAGILTAENEDKVTWLAVRHGLSSNGNDHVHLAVQLAGDDDWINPYEDFKHAQKACRRLEKTHDDLMELERRKPLSAAPYEYSQWRQWAEWKARHDWIGRHAGPYEELPADEQARMNAAYMALDAHTRTMLVRRVAADTMPRIHVARLVEACAIASRTEDEFIRRVRREGVQIDPFLRKGTGRDTFDKPSQVTGYRITWRSDDGWTERFNTKDLGTGFRLKQLREHWRHDPHEDALAVLEWKAAMENKPPAIHDGAERQPDNLSVHDLERMIDIAFHQAMNLRDATPEQLDRAIREGVRTFDQLRERYGEPDATGITGMEQHESRQTGARTTGA